MFGHTLSLPRVVNFKFPLQPQKKYYIIQYEERAFHSFNTQMVDDYITILSTSCTHLSAFGRMYVFEVGSERYKLNARSLHVRYKLWYGTVVAISHHLHPVTNMPGGVARI